MQKNSDMLSGNVKKKKVHSKPEIIRATLVKEKGSAAPWGYYDICLNDKGGVNVQHRIQDRMSSDENERYVFGADDLSRITRREFVKRFSQYDKGQDYALKLEAWLIEVGIEFAEPGTGQNIYQFMEYKREQEEHERVIKRLNELKNDKLSAWTINMVLKNEFPEYIRKHGIPAAQTAGTGSRRTDSVTPGRQGTEGNYETAPRMRIDSAPVKPKWFSDTDDVFRNVRVDGELRIHPEQIWCDSRGKDAGYVLECMDARKEDARKELRWFVIVDGLKHGDLSETVAFIKSSFPKWRVSWVLPQDTGNDGCQCVDHGKLTIVRVWLAPLENTRYCSCVEWMGYSHDGSEDYYRLFTRPYVPG